MRYYLSYTLCWLVTISLVLGTGLAICTLVGFPWQEALEITGVCALVAAGGVFCLVVPFLAGYGMGQLDSWVMGYNRFRNPAGDLLGVWTVAASWAGGVLLYTREAERPWWLAVLLCCGCLLLVTMAWSVFALAVIGLHKWWMSLLEPPTQQTAAPPQEIVRTTATQQVWAPAAGGRPPVPYPNPRQLLLNHETNTRTANRERA